MHPTRSILVVEDCGETRAALVAVLQGAGYATEEADDGEVALAACEARAYELAVVDLNLPRLGGLALVGQLRARGREEPVLLLSGGAAVEQRVAGLGAGGDAFLPKPFHARELLAHVAALLRRPQLRRTGGRLRFGDLSVDLALRRAERAGAEVPFSPREWALLGLLAERAGTTVSRSDLLRLGWEYRATVYSRTVDTYVWRLRRKLGESPRQPRWILGRPGRGYELDPSACDGR